MTAALVVLSVTVAVLLAAVLWLCWVVTASRRDADETSRTLLHALLASGDPRAVHYYDQLTERHRQDTPQTDQARLDELSWDDVEPPPVGVVGH